MSDMEADDDPDVSDIDYHDQLDVSDDDALVYQPPPPTMPQDGWMPATKQAPVDDFWENKAQLILLMSIMRAVFLIILISYSPMSFKI